ncbi:MAG: hypothetical protein B5M53_00470, partial [Candidatus Cloacimonas sp. 4484_209]
MKRKILLVLALVFCAMSLKADTLERLSAIKSGTPWDNKAVGKYDYLTNRAATAIIDISDSTNPVLTFETNGAPITWSHGVDIINFILYVNHGGSNFWIGRAIPPDTIIFITFYDLPNSSVFPSPWGIEVIDTVLFVADGNDGLFIFNVKDPYNPTQISFYDTPDNLTEFFILDSLIYL